MSYGKIAEALRLAADAVEELGAAAAVEVTEAETEAAAVILGADSAAEISEIITEAEPQAEAEAEKPTETAADIQAAKADDFNERLKKAMEILKGGK